MERTGVEIARARGGRSPAAHPSLPCRYQLDDGREFEVDYLQAGDRNDLLAGFAGLSAQSRYLRFFSAMPELPDFIADGLLKTDRINHVALGARLLDDSGNPIPSIIGVARYFRSAEALSVAEPAIAVVDDLHGHGIAKHLLRRLSAIARANGITHFRAQVLGDNRRMRAMLLEANATFVEQDDDVLTYQIDIRRQARAPRGVLARLLAVMQGSHR